MATGIRVRHATDCRKRSGAARCNCAATYEAWIATGKRGGKMRRSFKSEAAAKAWRSEAQAAVNRGELQANTAKTVREAAAELTAGMESGAFRNRSGDSYKPSVIRSYELALRLHVLPDIGRSSCRNCAAVTCRHSPIACSPADKIRAPCATRSSPFGSSTAARCGTASVHEPVRDLDLPAVRGGAIALPRASRRPS